MHGSMFLQSARALQQVVDVVILVAVIDRGLQLDGGVRYAMALAGYAPKLAQHGVVVALVVAVGQHVRGERDVAGSAKPATCVSMWPARASSDRLPDTVLPTNSATMSSAVNTSAARRLRRDASRNSWWS